MTPQTLTEKLLSRAAGRRLHAGDVAICRPDLALCTEGTISAALEVLAQLDGGQPGKPFDARRIAFALGHSGGLDDALPANLEAARDYAARHGITLFEVNQGIGHQRVLETGRALPGQLAVSADAHAVAYGAFNAYGTRIGTADLASVMYCGQAWLTVPPSIHIALNGRLPPGVAAKDLALEIVSRLGSEGASRCALEYGGNGVGALDMDDRAVLAHIAVEVGAEAALFRCDIKTRALLAETIGARPAAALVGETPDVGARYAETLSIDLEQVEPMVETPQRGGRVMPIADVPATPIDAVYLGSCTGGRIKDYRQALAVLREGGGVGQGIRLLVTPASEPVRAEMEASGMLAEFARLGAEITPPGCGACGAPCHVFAPMGRIASTAMRHVHADVRDAREAVYLASPAECARAAVTGRLGGMT